MSALTFWKRRRLQTLSPEDLEKALQRNDGYWTEEALQILVDRADEAASQSVHESLELAKLAVRFCGYPPPKSNDLKAFAHLVLGTAYRRLGRHSEAGEQYRLAAVIPELSREIRFRLHIRVAILHSALFDHEQAKLAMDKAWDLAESKHDEVKAWATLAVIHRGEQKPEEAIHDLLMGLNEASPNHFDSYFAIVVQLGDLLARYGDVEDIRIALTQLSCARASLARKKNHVKAAAYISWVEGVLTARLGSGRKAARDLRRAFSGLAAMGSIDDSLMVAIDLVKVLIEMEEPHSALEVYQSALAVSSSSEAWQEPAAILLAMIDASDLGPDMLETLSQAVESAAARECHLSGQSRYFMLLPFRFCSSF